MAMKGSSYRKAEDSGGCSGAAQLPLMTMAQWNVTPHARKTLAQ